ncbi:MAG: hypothetical protein H7Y07_13950 [Pyrinomonadaceae bacterium]|nr:hypothetical protein [Sphingobacteriaceae bacterium]
MSIEEFDLLEEYNKTLLVYNGVFITGREDLKFAYELYHVANFYVEAKFELQKSVVVSFLPFKTPNLLDKYLDNLSLTSLISGLF